MMEYNYFSHLMFQLFTKLIVDMLYELLSISKSAGVRSPIDVSKS
jgi:hypothetical protein